MTNHITHRQQRKKKVEPSRKTEAPSKIIPLPVRCTLWGMAGGRCERCNRLVYRDPTTKELVNISEAAHIIGFSKNGPRGEKYLSKKLAKDVTNLMLLCRICHRTIDNNKKCYPTTLLSEMKIEHEHRVETQTGINKNKFSHIILYGSNIGDLRKRLSYDDVASAMIPLWYPAETTPIALVDTSGTFRDKTAIFWKSESAQLSNWVAQHIQPRLASGSITHLSIFGLAPQPLLMLFGSLLTDIPAAQVYQLHREPADWCWQKKPTELKYIINEPRRKRKTPALILSLSATIADDRITSVLGKEVAIWRVCIKQPHNDFVKVPEQLRTFRETMRPLMDRIKAMHGQNTVLHVFPAAPASLCVEFGRIRMPKADMPLRVYDQNSALGGFATALDIGLGGDNAV